MRENTGSMKKNPRKEKDSHADYKGKCNVGGYEYWISGWIKDGLDREGKPEKYLSLAFDEVLERDAAAKPNTRNTYAAAKAGDDIPF